MDPWSRRRRLYCSELRMAAWPRRTSHDASSGRPRHGPRSRARDRAEVRAPVYATSTAGAAIDAATISARVPPMHASGICKGHRQCIVEEKREKLTPSHKKQPPANARSGGHGRPCARVWGILTGPGGRRRQPCGRTFPPRPLVCPRPTSPLHTLTSPHLFELDLTCELVS
jgi:hypothetical protein